MSEHDLLVSNVERASDIRQMCEKTGWKEIVGPWIFAQRNAAINEMLSPKTKPESLPFLRERVNTLDRLTNYIASILRIGEESNEKLKKE